ncbi:hypothetical protein [Acinetobacter dispersus]|uniref:Uncharacterized protein n=1 Tax=Acinetobacter dispersus TaxID=70348 RepID=N9LA02_9GAMM|nr:hypothetical protein [Acinetobacter dispersus]ENW93052.1 hypothetical protein F904_02995 [Acinetobacter dispersus]
MSFTPPNKIDSNVDSFSKALTLGFKLSTFLGGFCFVLYCQRLNYFPVGVTVGDSLLFLIFAASFGLVYGFIVLGLLSFGICWTYWLNPVFKYFHKYYKAHKLKKNNIEVPDPIAFVKPQSIHIMFAFFGGFFIFLMYKTDPSALFNLIATTFILSVIWGAHQDIRLNRSIFLPSAKEVTSTQRYDKTKKTKWLFIGLIIFIPLFFSGVSGQLLDAGMRFSNLNAGMSYILVKPPYDKAIPAHYQDKQPIYTEQGFTTFKNIEVVLTGIGQKTVVQFTLKPNMKPQTLAIPNDKIIVIPANTP